MSDIEKLIESISNGYPNLLSDSVLDVSNGNEEVIVSGNRQGLVLLAFEILRVAESGSEGSHYHLDECSIADTAETNVVFTIREKPEVG